MRNGPKPLGMFLNYAAIKQMQQSLGDIPGSYSSQDIEAFVAGVKKYQSYEHEAFKPDREVVWQQGAANLQRASGGPQSGEGAVVLLVPSLVNGSGIFDLGEDVSFLRFLGQCGIEAVMLDWGNLIEDPGLSSVEGAVGRLCNAIRALYEKTGRKIHVLGYCLGGTLLAAAAMHTKECMASATFLATPWDFEEDSNNLARRVRFWVEKAEDSLRQKDVLPGEWIHTLLASLHPQIIVQKYIKFSEMEEGSDEEQLFVAVEDWLNESIDLPLAFAEQYIQDLFFDNKARQHAWECCGEIVDTARIECPVLIIASKSDKLIDVRSALALYETVNGATLIQPDCGHIGMMSGRKAKGEVWQKFADWVLQSNMDKG